MMIKKEVKEKMKKIAGIVAGIVVIAIATAVIITAVAVIIISVVSAATIYVPTDYPTIQEAVNSAMEGDTIFVYNGTYNETTVGLRINTNRITLQGENLNTTIIDGEGAWSTVFIQGNYINFTGFTVTGSSKSGTGIYLKNSGNCKISGNNVTGNGIGIQLRSSDKNQIIKNTVKTNENGIKLRTSRENNITENLVANNRYGVYLDISGDNQVYHNNFVGNTNQAFDNNFNRWNKRSETGGNYWLDHICHGNPSEQPYSLILGDAGAIDRYPFKNMNGWEKPTIKLTTDKKTYWTGDKMQIKICIENKYSQKQIKLGWWLTIPQLGYADILAYAPLTLSAGYNECFEIPIAVENWSSSGFGAVWGAGLFELDTGEVINYSTCKWNYISSDTGSGSEAKTAETVMRIPKMEF